MDLVKDKSISVNHTCTRIAAYIWLMFGMLILMFLGGFIFDIVKVKPGYSIWLIVSSVFGAVFFVASIGCLLKRSWGRKFGFFCCFISLPIFPIGTAASVLGLYGLVKGRAEYKSKGRGV